MDPLPYYNRAQVWAAEGLADKALADCTQAIKLKPTWADPYVHRGNLYSEQKQYDQAIKDYSEALRLSPNHVGILTNRAMSSFDHGDLEKALSDCNAIIQLDSHHHQAMYYRAQIWLKKKVYNKALHDLDSCLKREPESLVLRYQLATVLATCPDSKSRDGKRAVDIAKALSLEAESKYPPFLELLASAYAECSDFSRAVEWQKRALKEWEHTKDDRTTPPQHAAIPYVRQLLSRSPKDQKDESLRRLRLYEQQRPYRQE
jgi:tetratricopeptide (TPR) repeat protein